MVSDLAASVSGLLGDDARANGILGALVNPDVKARLEAASGLGEVALSSKEITHPDFPDAVVRTPVIVKLDGAKPDAEAAYLQRVLRPGLLRGRRRFRGGRGAAARPDGARQGSDDRRRVHHVARDRLCRGGDLPGGVRPGCR
ncbi:hypothetical protein SALBM135S_01807 [Streptomyces alboniger]